jgi:quercetin dioxygenase-like cupin family protein
MMFTGRDSDGRLTIYESIYAEDVGHPLHIHHDATESFYMLAGTCRFLVEGETITVTEGSFLSIPTGATHGLVPVGGSARALVIFAPAAMEGYWRELAAATAAGCLDDTTHQQLQRAYHLEIVGPWPEPGPT